MSLPRLLTLYFDGSCEPNPGGVATAGLVIQDEVGKPVYEDALFIGQGPKSTNNVAEYMALGKGLRWLFDQGWQGELAICGDSKLVIEQLNRKWACRAENLIPLRDRCFELLERLGNQWTATWVPREQNSRADALAQAAYVKTTGRPYPERKKRA